MDLGGTHFSVKSNEQSRKLQGFTEKDFKKSWEGPISPMCSIAGAVAVATPDSRPPRYAGQSPLVAIDHPNVHASQAHAACKA